MIYQPGYPVVVEGRIPVDQDVELWEAGSPSTLGAIAGEDRARDIAELNSVTLSYDQVKRGSEAYFAQADGTRGTASNYDALIEFSRGEGLGPADAVGNALIYRATLISSYRRGGVDDPEVLDAIAREPVTVENYGLKFADRVTEDDVPY